MHPEKIGPYRIDRKIGSGGMGNVYLGVHEDTAQQAAVKVLPASMAREEGFVARFSREIHALKQLSSPYIVELYEDGETGDGSYYYSMEFVDGETLTSMVTRRKRIPWQEVIEISLDIAAALKAAHIAGIVHRDLKPSNLMVGKDGQIKLTDFGVARVFATTRLTRTGGVVGTAEYMSPEQARGVRATKLSDLYSLGAVMYVMLTGRPPFTGKMASDILHKHQFSQFDKPSHYVPELPRELEDFVSLLMEKKPENRPQDALVVIRRLEAIRAKLEYVAKADAATEVTAARQVDRTAGVAHDRTRGAESSGDRGPGPATMVRDILRQDLDDQLRKSPLARFFDNTFVLIICFCLVIVAGMYLSRTTQPQPEELLDEARSAFQASPSQSWLRARDELLQPLLDADALQDDRAEIVALIDRADQFEFCRRLRISTARDGTSDSEIERLIRKGFDDHASGEIVKARRQLEAVLNVIGQNSRYEYLSEFLQETLKSWNAEHDAAGRRSFIDQVMENAAAAFSSGDQQKAVELLRAALELYNGDEAVKIQVARCRELLNSYEAENSANKAEAN